MKNIVFSIVCFLSIFCLFLNTVTAQESRNPPIDSLCFVFAGVGFGGDFSSPLNYPNGKHIANAKVGNQFIQAITWHTGMFWGQNSVVSRWDDMFNIWAYPDSVSTSQGEVARNCCVCADDKGDFHFAWYQSGNPDGTEIFYTRAILDTSAGWIEYTIESPPIMISATNGESEQHPAIATFGDSLIMIVYTVGAILHEHAIGYNYSTDGGDTWLGPFIGYDHHGVMSGDRFLLPSLAVNPNDGDMWIGLSFDYAINACNDIVALQWRHSPGDTWGHELVAAGQSIPNNHALSCPSIVVDQNGIPHVIFLECLLAVGFTYPHRYHGPFGTLYYAHRQGGAWSTPSKIMFPRYEFCNYWSGYPSAGIASDNTIYFSTTQPESALSDSTEFRFPINVFYGSITPYTGAVSYGGMVSNIALGDSVNAIYAHTAYRVALPSEVPPGMEGPDITWSQMVDASAPSDIYYCHKDLILPPGIEEEPVKIRSSLSLTACPNPFAISTTIHVAGIGQRIERTELQIFDVMGRRVRDFILYPSSFFLPTKVEWDGRNSSGEEVSPGVYFVKFGGGKKVLTRKLIMVK